MIAISFYNCQLPHLLSTRSASIKALKITSNDDLNEVNEFCCLGDLLDNKARSVLMYGSETWSVTKKVEDILKGCDRKMIRYITGIKWKEQYLVWRF